MLLYYTSDGRTKTLSFEISVHVCITTSYAKLSKLERKSSLFQINVYCVTEYRRIGE
jgi:hypothetical protein